MRGFIQEELAVLLSFKVVCVSDATDFIGADTDFLTRFHCGVVMLFNHRQGDSVISPMPHSEVEKLVEEAHKVSQDFWSNAKFDKNTTFDERLKRLDEIAERLEKFANYSLSQARYKHSPDK